MDLQIVPEEAKTTGNKILSLAEEFDSLLKKVTEINNELKPNWEGDEATKYLGAIEQQAKIMQDLKETITETGNFLVNAAKAYESTSAANASGIRG